MPEQKLTFSAVLLSDGSVSVSLKADEIYRLQKQIQYEAEKRVSPDSGQVIHGSLEASVTVGGITQKDE